MYIPELTTVNRIAAVADRSVRSRGVRAVLADLSVDFQVGDECSSLSGQLVGHCVIRELDEVPVVRLGRPVFADVSIVQLDDNVILDNSLLETVDSHHPQMSCRYSCNSVLSVL